MNTFIVGQRVVANTRANEAGNLTVGKEYIVERTIDDDMVALCGIPGGYYCYRFDAVSVYLPKTTPINVELTRVGEAVSLRITGNITEAQVAAALKAVYA